jgi:uncharacterized membrane protein
MMLLSLAAMAVTLLLIQAHFQTSEAGSFCNINDYWNCDRVNKSVFAEIFGIPVSILGFLYYVFITVLYFALIKGFDFNKKFQPVTTKVMLTGMTIISSVFIAILFTLELGLLKGFFWVAVIKSILLLLINYYIYRYCQKHPGPYTDFLGFMSILTVFGVIFSLYLTDIELFVLQAFCIFCVTQQIIIAIISVINLLALKNSKNDHSTIAG